MPVPSPASALAASPVQLGLRLGIAGATAGLGFAAIRRALQARKTRKVQPAVQQAEGMPGAQNIQTVYVNGTPAEPEAPGVVKPVLAGAAIGFALGAGLGAARWRYDRMSTKFAALGQALEKKAILEDYGNLTDEHPWLSTAGYLTPGLGAVMSAADASRNFSQGQWVRGIGNALMVPLGIVGAGGVLKALPRMAGVARAAQAGGKGIKATRAAMVPGGVLGNMGRLQNWAETAGTKLFQGPLSRMAPEQAMRLARRGKAVEDFFGAGVQHRFKGLARIPGLRKLSPYNASWLTGTAMTMLPTGGDGDEMSGGDSVGSYTTRGGYA